MGIYRGAGGTGDATNDASSEASIVVVAKDAALAAQAAAEAAQAGAVVSGGAAASSATAAALSATNAATSATTALGAISSTQAAAAQASDASIAAQSAQTAAETAETNAETAATNAAAYELSANEWATKTSGPVAGGEYSAKYNANLAATSATNASNSATAASSSASTASTAATNAAASYDAFDDRYLGSKSSAPTVDNDGNTLLVGALYFNTVSNAMKVWDGTQWLDAYASLGGAVTSVTASSPVTSSGGSSPNIALPAATTSVNGYLTSTDWNTFNSKGNGTVTSVTGTAPVVSSGGATPAISMAAATTSVNGYLTSTDWTTFNAKASVSTTNTFTANQIVSVTDNTNAALRITQLGTGNALLVEDSTNPDSTPFVVDASGNVGIGTTPVVQNGRALQIDGGAGAADLRITNNATGSVADNGLLYSLINLDGYVWNLENAFLSIGTNNTERMRITSAGELLVGSTSLSGARVMISATAAGGRTLYLNKGTGDTTDYFIVADTTTANRFLLAGTGDIGTAGAIRIGEGSLPTSGIGIQFPATQVASSNANTLDDYEEGTWTPVLRGGTTAGTYVYDTNRTGGQYVKIGRLVTIRGVVSISSVTSAGTGNAQITGAPFAQTNVAPSFARSPGNLTCQGGTTAMANSSIFCSFHTTGDASIEFQTQSTTNITNIPVTTVDDVSSIWAFTYTYLTDN
jgi:hypothetical protein